MPDSVYRIPEIPETFLNKLENELSEINIISGGDGGEFLPVLIPINSAKFPVRLDINVAQ